MDINFPKHQRVAQSVALFVLPAFCVLVVSMLYGLNLWLSAFLSLLAIAVISFFKIYRYRRHHSKFLDSFGKSIKNSYFYQSEYAIGAVPFANKFLSCSARIEGDNLLFGRSRHFRLVELEKIIDIEILTCLGHEVAKLEIEDSKDDHPLFIPWSPLLAEKVKFSNGI